MSDNPIVETHPVQGQHSISRAPTAVTLRAYEVYTHVYGPQEALITDDCRGGFSPGELIAFLYARSFPQREWRSRVDEAFKGLEGYRGRLG